MLLIGTKGVIVCNRAVVSIKNIRYSSVNKKKNNLTSHILKGYALFLSYQPTKVSDYTVRRTNIYVIITLY